MSKERGVKYICVTPRFREDFVKIYQVFIISNERETHLQR